MRPGSQPSDRSTEPRAYRVVRPQPRARDLTVQASETHWYRGAALGERTAASWAPPRRLGLNRGAAIKARRYRQRRQTDECPGRRRRDPRPSDRSIGPWSANRVRDREVETSSMVAIAARRAPIRDPWRAILG